MAENKTGVSFTAEDIERVTGAPTEEYVPPVRVYSPSDITFTAEDAAALGGQYKDPTSAEYLEAQGMGFGRGALETGAMVTGSRAGYELGRGIQALTAGVPHPAIQMAGRAAPFIGGALGAGYGLFANPFQEEIEQLTPEPEREDLKQTFEVFRTIGSGPPGAFLAQQFRGRVIQPALDPTWRQRTWYALNKSMDDLGNYARSDVKGLLAKETIASIYAGSIGTNFAMSMDPENTGLRFFSEVATSTLAPSKFIGDLRDGVIASANAAREQGGTDATMRYVADSLANLVEQAGENPLEMAKRVDSMLANLPRSGEGKIIPTSPQVFDSPVLTALDKQLARDNAKYKIGTEQQGHAALKAYETIVNSLLATGNPRLIENALGAAYLKDSSKIQSAIRGGYARAGERLKALQIKSGREPTQVEVGQTLSDEMDKVIKLLSDTESQLWADATRALYRLNAQGTDVLPLTVKPKNFVKAYLDLAAGPASGVLEETIPQYGTYTATVKRLGIGQGEYDSTEEALNAAAESWKKGIDPVSFREKGVVNVIKPELLDQITFKDAPANELVKLRTALLSEARSVSSGTAPDTDKARRLMTLANAVLEDISTLDNVAYGKAREFTRSYHDMISRTFAGKMDDTSPNGALSLPPELIVRATLAGGADTTYLRMKQIYDAANLAGPAAGGENLPGQILNTQRNIMLEALDRERGIFKTAQTVDPATGATVEKEVVDPNKLALFREKHAGTLKLLGMEDDFVSAEMAQRSLLDIENGQNAFVKSWKDEKFLQSIMNGNDPALVLGRVLNSERPVIELNKIIDKARKGRGDEGVNAVKSALYQYASREAMDAQTKSLSFVKLKNMLYGKLTPNTPSLMSVMRDARLVSGGEYQMMRKALERPARIEEQMLEKIQRTGGLDIEDFGRMDDVLSGLDKLVLAQLSARFAGLVNPGGPGSLSFAARTIAFAENMFRGFPARKREEALFTVMRDPELMVEMLKRGRTAEQKRALDAALLRRMYAPGSYTGAVDRYMNDVEYKDDRPLDVPTFEEEMFAPGFRMVKPKPSQSSSMLQNMPTAQTRGLAMAPTAGAPQQMAAAPAQGPAPTGQGSSREMLQRLFPMDTMLG